MCSCDINFTCTKTYRLLLGVPFQNKQKSMSDGNNKTVLYYLIVLQVLWITNKESREKIFQELLIEVVYVNSVGEAV